MLSSAGIVVTAYASLGVGALLTRPEVLEAAKQHSKSAAQVKSVMMLFEGLLKRASAKLEYVACGVVSSMTASSLQFASLLFSPPWPSVLDMRVTACVGHDCFIMYITNRSSLYKESSLWERTWVAGALEVGPSIRVHGHSQICQARSHCRVQWRTATGMAAFRCSVQASQWDATTTQDVLGPNRNCLKYHCLLGHCPLHLLFDTCSMPVA